MRLRNLVVAASVMLNVGLLAYLVFGPSEPAIFISESFAQNRTVAGGGYAATTANVTTSKQALWLVDNREKRMIIYQFASGGRKKKLDPIGARDLRRDFGETLAGEVILLPGQVSSGTDAVYVIDPAGKKLVAYATEGKGIEVLGARNLDQDFRQ